MKIIAVGDVHGTDDWIVSATEPTDHFVFIGDYFDAYTDEIAAADEIANFINILDLKKDNPDMVTLLIGNHDFHYLKAANQHYSRYQHGAAAEIGNLLEESLDHMQMCFVYQDIVFSHAGMTKTWCANNLIDLNDLENSINEKFSTNPAAFAFVRGIGDDDGSDVRQSPIWVRPKELLSDKIDGFKQVVGHTRQPCHQIIKDVAFIDVPGIPFILEEVNSFSWG